MLTITNRHPDQQIDRAVAYSERFITLFAGALFLVFAIAAAVRGMG